MACLLFVSQASDSIVTGQQNLYGGQPCTHMTSPHLPVHFTSAQTLTEPFDTDPEVSLSLDK